MCQDYGYDDYAAARRERMRKEKEEQERREATKPTSSLKTKERR